MSAAIALVPPPPPATSHLFDTIEVCANVLAEGVGKGGDHAVASKREQRTVVAAGVMDLSVTALTSSKVLAGGHTLEGARHVNNVNEAARVRDDCYRKELAKEFLVPRMEAHRKLTDFVGYLAEDGVSELAPWRATSFFQFHCENCAGDGVLDCRVCRASQTESCPQYNCSGGQAPCGACSGTTVVISGADRVRCNRCSYGRVTCPTCYGRTVITCRGCNGAGRFRCKPCAATGVITQVEGFALNMKRASQYVCEPGVRDEATVKAWVRDGFKGGKADPKSADEPMVGREAAKLEYIAPAEGKAPGFRYTVLGAVSEATVTGSVAGYPFVGWCYGLPGALPRFDAFLTPRAREIALEMENHSKTDTPSALMERVSNSYPHVGTDLKTIQSKGFGVPEARQALASTLCGSVDGPTITRIVEAQAACISRFGDTAARMAWKWPTRLLFLAAAAPFLMDLPWVSFSERDNAPAAMAVFGMAVVFGLIVMAADLMGRNAVRREVGSSRQFRPNFGRRRMAALVALVAGCGIFLPQAGVGAGPFRSATHEFREIVGLPHLKCVQPNAKLVAEHCPAAR
jgi:hypothetical protein